MPFVKAGDLVVYYIERGEGEPIVFVHGNWVTGTVWEPVLQRLPSGYRGIAYDMRGRGKTEGPDNDYTMPEMAADLRNFVDALGLGRFHLVALSLGSAVGMQFALESPERVKTLTVVSPAWVDGMPEAYNLPDAQMAIKNDRALFGQALKAQAPTVTEDEFWQRVCDEGHQQGVEATLRNLPALMAWKPGDHLQSINVPTLVVSGALDPLTGGENAKRAVAALDAHRHVDLQGVGHTVPLEAPDLFVDLLLEHIQSAVG